MLISSGYSGMLLGKLPTSELVLWMMLLEIINNGKLTTMLL